MIAARSARPGIAGTILITVGWAGLYYFLPESGQQDAQLPAGVEHIESPADFCSDAVCSFWYTLALTAIRAGSRPVFAGSLCLFGIARLAPAEFIREAVRKPFGCTTWCWQPDLPEEAPKIPRPGIWKAAYGRRPMWPSTIADDRGRPIRRRAY